MDKCKDKKYDRGKKNEVINMVTVPQRRVTGRKMEVNKSVESCNKKKKSALDISDSIGVYGAFGRSLMDFHKQGR